MSQIVYFFVFFIFINQSIGIENIDTILKSTENEIDGRWIGTLQGPQGEMELTFNFKVDGDDLTGTVEGPMGRMPITNGKIFGDDFTFDVDADGVMIGHQCTLEGDTISMRVTGLKDEMDVTLTRV